MYNVVPSDYKETYDSTASRKTAALCQFDIYHTIIMQLMQLYSRINNNKLHMLQNYNVFLNKISQHYKLF